jgi:hypothetical protein
MSRGPYTPLMQPEAVPLEPIAADATAAPGTTIAPVIPSNTTDAAPVRDAQRITERIDRDEALADAARERYRSNGLPELEPSALLGILNPGERLHAVHRMAMLEEGWRGSTGADANLPHGGTLYVTSQRLVHRGTDDGIWSFDEIDEMAVSLERLLLVRLRDGSDLAIEVDQPRLLRVQLAAALSAARHVEVPGA